MLCDQYARSLSDLTPRLLGGSQTPVSFGWEERRQLPSSGVTPKPADFAIPRGGAVEAGGGLESHSHWFFYFLCLDWNTLWPAVTSETSRGAEAAEGPQKVRASDRHGLKLVGP